ASHTSTPLPPLASPPASRRGELTNAAQIPPYRLSGGAVESVSLPSFPLGLSERNDFPSRELVLAAGDRLVFGTDGFIEAADPSGGPFGFERLETLLHAEAVSDAARLRDAILAGVAAHAGAVAPEDDRTLVILTID